jgi:hypothetical protein
VRDSSCLMTDPNCLMTGPSCLITGSSCLMTGPSCLMTGSSCLSAWKKVIGFQLWKEEEEDVEENARTDPAKTGLQGAFGYPTRHFNTPRSHVNGSRNNTSRECGANDIILPLLLRKKAITIDETRATKMEMMTGKRRSRNSMLCAVSRGSPLLPQKKRWELPGVKYVFDAHTSKESERLKVVYYSTCGA